MYYSKMPGNRVSLSCLSRMFFYYQYVAFENINTYKIYELPFSIKSIFISPHLKCRVAFHWKCINMFLFIKCAYSDQCSLILNGFA